MTGVGGDNSWGMMPHEEYRIKPGEPLHYGFTFVPFSGKGDVKNLVMEY